MLVGILVILHLLAHLALHVLILSTGVTPVHLIAAVPAHVVLGSLWSPVASEPWLFVLLGGLWLVTVFEPGMLVPLGGRAIAHDYCATFGTPSNYYLLFIV